MAERDRTMTARWPRLPLVLLGAALVGAVALGVLPAGWGAARPVNAMAVDADPGTPAVDAARTVSSGATFLVSVNVTAAGTPYDTYQFELSWDNPSPATGLLYVGTNNAHLATGAGYDNCPGYTHPGITPPGDNDSVNSNCNRPAGASAFVGAVERVELRCLSDGNWMLHLVTLDEDSIFGTTTIGAGSSIGTSLSDATVTCGSGGPISTVTPPAGPQPTTTPGVGPSPGPLPTPLPGEREQIQLTQGCNLRALEPHYPHGVSLIAIIVDIDRGNPRIWLQIPGTPSFDLYDARSAERSTVNNLTQEAGFICLDEPATWNRPMVS